MILEFFEAGVDGMSLGGDGIVLPSFQIYRYQAVSSATYMLVVSVTIYLFRTNLLSNLGRNDTNILS